jgi:short subunit dehydrogenase-like uncharacterized protein
MQQTTFLLYGANGYTGELIARYAGQYGLTPILAGRREAAIAPLATKLGLPFLIFDLNDSAALKKALQEVPLVVNAAGPYDQTARPMVEACLETHTHYLDLNGDLEVFEMLQAYHQQAIDKDVMILPGGGFDVVPTDCMALWLKKQLPDAHKLKIAFATFGSTLSHGTAITTLQKLGMPGATRKGGAIVPEPLGKKGMWITFPSNKQRVFVMTIPWGDISTAYYTTGIPNIETYTGMNIGTWRLLKVQSLFNWLLRTSFMHQIIKGIIHRRAPGPDDAMREKAQCLVWAQVTNPKGNTLTATMRCPEAYALTAFAILIMSQKILNNNYKPGYQTPASAYGENLVLEIPGVERDEVPVSSLHPL